MEVGGCVGGLGGWGWGVIARLVYLLYYYKIVFVQILTSVSSTKVQILMRYVRQVGDVFGEPYVSYADVC